MDGKGCRPPSPSVPCCDVKSNNGGFWTFSPTSAGKLLLELWLAALWQDSVVERKIWTQNSWLDYGLLGKILAADKMDNYSLNIFRVRSWEPQHIFNQLTNTITTVECHIRTV